MFGVINKIFDPNQKRLDKLKPVLGKINELEDSYKNKSDEELLANANDLKNRIRDDLKSLNIKDENYPQQEKDTLNKYVTEAFALVRETFARTLNERSFDEQLMVGLMLHEGNAAEQKTGEGKTHAAVHPMLLNALTGRGAHLVTVNDYLARRDAEWMGIVYSKLGLSIGCINTNSVSYIFDPEKAEELKPEDGNWRKFAFGHGDLLREVSRREAYAADVTYGTNNEFGFDYLRDNMVHSLDQLVQVNANGEVGVHHFAIVDEVDSILIDEARTPLIISSPAEESNELYVKFAGLVKRLNSEDYELDEKGKNAFLNDLGVKKIEKWLGTDNVYENFEYAHHLEQALKAQYAYERDVDYLVQNDEVKIVDEFTGRVMEGRRYSEGLHQALEAKEEVAIQKESKTVATITFQNYFRLYEKLSGMSATIMTEAEEFFKIYSLESVSVPTHKQVARIDHPDRIYKNQRAKWKAIVDEIEELNKTGQPVLVGTTSVEFNELVSQLLKRRNVPHEILNAKNHEREAEIVSQAGQKGSVTVATNMAGRGTDIKLGDGVKEMGGLFVIGTERHEARRIDNQLRGRSGRQGDPGASRFYVGLDDNLMRIFGGDRIAGLMTRFNLPDDMPIENSMISRSIESAQQKVEGHNFDIRKHLVEYDDVINKQREIIYKRRRRLLELGDPRFDTGEFNLETEIIKKAEQYAEDVEAFTNDLNAKKAILPKLNFDELLKYVFLTTIDHLWMEHIDALDELRAGIGLRGYGQREPLVEFKNEGYRMFEQLISSIDYEIVNRFHKIRIQTPESVRLQDSNVLEKTTAQQKEVGQFESGTTTSNSSQSPAPNPQPATRNPQQNVQPVVKSDAEQIGRNDPCPCGSGKKYKKCHGAPGAEPLKL
ncbi:SEC-C domain-containing protein [candidate division WWE3 bacterium]|uniref:Protein translocase subunit SecA n=1 Tax=candidate division WWE3 bacterium TaxID=2053526 RepID=A0A955RRJ9_UNCKA|nr:SEC-C domain-containing protein [candidate division WWE3 bacterium]